MRPSFRCCWWRKDQTIKSKLLERRFGGIVRGRWSGGGPIAKNTDRQKAASGWVFPHGVSRMGDDVGDMSRPRRIYIVFVLQAYIVSTCVHTIAPYLCKCLMFGRRPFTLNRLGFVDILACRVMTGLSKRIHDVSFKDRGSASPSLHSFFPNTPGGTGMSQYSSLNGEGPSCSVVVSMLQTG